jgi:hypothetical protein
MAVMPSPSRDILFERGDMVRGIVIAFVRVREQKYGE